jgi:hypothetical protein
MLEKVCGFSYLWSVVIEGSSFVVFVPVDFFLGFLRLICWLSFCMSFAESYCFVQLVVLKSILLDFFSLLMEVSAFWQCDVCRQQFYVV